MKTPTFLKKLVSKFLPRSWSARFTVKPTSREDIEVNSENVTRNCTNQIVDCIKPAYGLCSTDCSTLA